MQDHLSQLLAFVLEHDCARDAVIQDGAIYATLHWVDRNGVAGSEWQRVGNRLNEVRDWLQY